MKPRDTRRFLDYLRDQHADLLSRHAVGKTTPVEAEAVEEHLRTHPSDALMLEAMRKEESEAASQTAPTPLVSAQSVYARPKASHTLMGGGADDTPSVPLLTIDEAGLRATLTSSTVDFEPALTLTVIVLDPALWNATLRFTIWENDEEIGAATHRFTDDTAWSHTLVPENAVERDATVTLEITPEGTETL